MRALTRCLTCILTTTPSALVLSLTVFASSTAATEIFVDTSLGGGQVGGFYGPYTPEDDIPPGYPPIIEPDNDPLFQNYFMGRTTTSPVSTGFTTPERRAFFFFDMATISIPAGEVITSVTIDLELLAGGTSALANFTEDVEVVEFSSTPFSAGDILDPDAASTPPDVIWDTFGTSTPYGGFEIFSTEHPTEPPTIPDTYTIPLPGSFADVESAIIAGDIFVVTARLATFDPDPIGESAPPAADPYEYVFGLTDVVTEFGSSTAAPELVITTTLIPEPTTLSILTLSLALLATRRQT